MSTVERQIVAVVGILVAALGVATFFSPGIASIFAADEFLLTIIGVLALFQGTRIARDRWGTDLAYTETGDPELIEGIPTPGDEFDDALRSAESVHELTGQDVVEERLEAVAIAALQRRRGCTAAEARELLETGGWTDDDLAAGFFDGRPWSAFPMGVRLRVRIRNESPYGLRAKRATSEIAGLWNGPDGSGSDE